MPVFPRAQKRRRPLSTRRMISFLLGSYDCALQHEARGNRRSVWRLLSRTYVHQLPYVVFL